MAAVIEQRQERRDLALAMVRSLGAHPVAYDIPGGRPCVVAGLGAGICMAVADWLVGHRLWSGDWFAGTASPIVCDLPGHLTREQRIMCLDYLGQEWPAIFLLWSSLGSADIYLDGLLARGFDPRKHDTRVYVQGLGAENAHKWAAAGFVVVPNLWTEDY